jgi:hypothetical protein
MGKPREQRLGEVFVSLADTLVADYDVIDLLYNLSISCVELLAVDTVGIMVTDGKGTLHTVASSHERTELLELAQLQNDEGPCLDTFRQGQPSPASIWAATEGGGQRSAPTPTTAATARCTPDRCGSGTR